MYYVLQDEVYTCTMCCKMRFIHVYYVLPDEVYTCTMCCEMRFIHVLCAAR